MTIGMDVRCHGSMLTPAMRAEYADRMARLVDRLREAVELLESIAADRSVLEGVPDEERKRLLQAVASVYHPDRVERRRMSKITARERKAARVKRDQGRAAETGIQTLRRKPVFHTPNVFPPEDVEPPHSAPHPRTSHLPRRTAELQHCYICKQKYTEIHHFYDQLCPGCAGVQLPQAHRARRPARARGTADGRPREDRVPGGTQAAALRCAVDRDDALSARFRGPLRAASRISPTGATGWRSSVSTCATRPASRRSAVTCSSTRTRLDFIVNNACQTVRRPPDFYAHMMEGETAALDRMPPHVRKLLGAYEGLRGYHLLPEGAHATARPRTCGNAARAAHVPGLTRPAELSQVRLLPDEVGRAAGPLSGGHGSIRIFSRSTCATGTRGGSCWPTCRRWSCWKCTSSTRSRRSSSTRASSRSCCARPERDKHIVNVSAVEGQFYRKFKTTRHPHTNMAKAALNMMTRTAATDYHGDGIHMNSVDTGWVTDEDPVEIAARKTAEQRFHPPLDIVDGAARIVDPDHRRVQHGHARVGAVPEGLQADRLVGPAEAGSTRVPRIRAFRCAPSPSRLP